MSVYPLSDLTAFQRDLLVAVRDAEEQHGLGLGDYLADYYNGEIHHGRLYPNLDTLVEKGLLQKAEIDRRTNKYELTTRGTRELETHTKWFAGESA